MLILGVDPGTARLGWGVIQDKSGRQTVDSYGCLQTATGNTDAHRLEALFKQFVKLLKKFKPDAVAVENIFFFKNQKTVIQVSQVRGVILLACQQLNIASYSYSPLEIKMAVTGFGKADKNQVAQMTKAILKLKTIPQPDDTADALAVALTHAFSYKMKSLSVSRRIR